MTAKKFKIKRGDLVQVIAGKEKGKRGEVSSVVKADDRVVVKGINLVTRFAKQNAQNPNGVYQKEASLHISNVALVNPGTDAPAKVGYRMNDAGKKERYFKNDGVAV